MDSTLLDKQKRNLPWWAWPIAPFALLAALFGLLFILLILAVVAPFLMVSRWRFKRRTERKLRAEGRLIDWHGALLERSSDNKDLLVEISPKKVGDVWLVKLSPESQALFASYPTYSDFEVDAKAVWEKYKKDDERSKQLIPGMLAAKRIDTTSEAIAAWDKELKDSARVLTVLDDESPSALLYASLRKKTNA